MAGRTATLRLVWELEGTIPHSHLPVFVHFLEDGEVRFQADHTARLPVLRHTTVPKSLVLDEHEFTVPADCPAGEFGIRLGGLAWFPDADRLKPRTKLPVKNRAVEIGRVEGNPPRIEDVAERLVADRNLDRLAGIEDGGAAHHAVGRGHSDGPYLVVAEVLRYLTHDHLGLVIEFELDLQCMQDLGKGLGRELHVDDGACHLDDAAQGRCGCRGHSLCSLRFRCSSRS